MILLTSIESVLNLVILILRVFSLLLQIFLGRGLSTVLIFFLKNHIFVSLYMHFCFCVFHFICFCSDLYHFLVSASLGPSLSLFWLLAVEAKAGWALLFSSARVGAALNRTYVF